MNKLDELEKKYQELGAEIKKLKAEKGVVEWPKAGYGYYYVTSDVGIACFPWWGREHQMHHLASGNVHRTKEEAEAYKAWLTSPRTQARREVEMKEILEEKCNE